ncbi:MAG: CotH kinase family protein [Butyrivibrio sp.]|nr:CotH kinase family protein [Butyrivibrio sp.]
MCTHNKKAAHDEYGYYDSDYIEIFNPTNKTVNLLGWGLSDDSSKLGKYLFPNINIEPGQAIIAWSSEDLYSSEVWRDDYVPSDVHGIGFNISDGEKCILTDPSGKIVSTVVTPQYLDDSMTISSSKSKMDEYVVDVATPYYVKEQIIIEDEKDVLKAPEFSVEGGWFADPVTIELSCAEGDIYYTLDGTEPDQNSLKYTDPITIDDRSDEDNYYLNMEDIALENAYSPGFKVDKGTVVKAVAISDTGVSEISSKTFFVGLNEEDYEGISIMSLTISPDDFYGYEDGIYRVGSVNRTFCAKVDENLVNLPDSPANFGRKGKGWERDVKIEFFTNEHRKALEQDAGIRIHGGSSVNCPQKSFNLYAREEYDGSFSFNYDFYGNGLSYNRLVLRNGGSDDMYLSKMRDVFNQSLVKDRSIGAQIAIPCAVFLNGEYWGLYYLQEKACSNYVSNHYNIPEEDIVVVKTKDMQYVAADEKDESYASELSDIKSFIIENDMANDKNYRYVESKIDIQSLIDYYVLKVYTACIDAYFNNEVVWRTKSIGDGEYDDGKWRFLANDLDNSDYINNRFNSPDVDTFVAQNWVTERGPLIDEGFLSGLIANPEFKERFVTSFMDMMNNNFRYDKVAPKLWSDAGVIRVQDVKSQQAFWNGYFPDGYPGEDEIEFPFDESDFGFDVGLIDAFFRERPEYMKEYVRTDFELTGNLYTLRIVGNVASGEELKVNTSVISDYSGDWSGEYFGDYPVVLSIEGGDNNSFEGWYVDGELVSSEKTYVIPAGIESDDIVVEIK